MFYNICVVFVTGVSVYFFWEQPEKFQMFFFEWILGDTESSEYFLGVLEAKSTNPFAAICITTVQAHHRVVVWYRSRANVVHKAVHVFGSLCALVFNCYQQFMR